MLDPFIIDAIADANVGFVLSYRDKLPDRIINIARDYVDALYQEAANLNAQYDDILGIKQNKSLQARATTQELAMVVQSYSH